MIAILESVDLQMSAPWATLIQPVNQSVYSTAMLAIVRRTWLYLG